MTMMVTRDPANAACGTRVSRHDCWIARHHHRHVIIVMMTRDPANAACGTRVSRRRGCPPPRPSCP
jgi:hypothetical protein